MKVEASQQRSVRLRAQFASVFDDGAETPARPHAMATGDGVEIVRAPRSVHFMGDHTDLSDGLVLGAAVGPETWLAFRRRRDGLVRLTDAQPADARPHIAGERWGEFWIDAVSVVVPAVLADPSPLDFAAGAAWSLREAGLPVRGLDGMIDGSIGGYTDARDTGGDPGNPGGDPGRSTALELAVALALLGGARLIDHASLAALVHRAEREYVGRIDGMADHFLATAGRTGRAVLLDCRSLESHLVTLPAGLRVVVCETGAPPLSAALLADRRAECGRAMALLSERMPGLVSLRDLDLTLLKRHRAVLPQTLARRAEHVVSETMRVMSTAAALEMGDLDMVGRLFAESHDSLRRLYDVGSASLDALVEIARAVPGVVGSRMIGPGGTQTATLVLEDAVPALVAAVGREYPRRTGLPARAYEVAVVNGAGPLD